MSSLASRRSLFLGVDGGGTKTHFVLVDGDGNVIATSDGSTSYYPQIGMDGLRTVLADGLGVLFSKAQVDPSDVAHAFFGLPAYGEDSAAQLQLDALPELLVGHRRYRCGNDMVCAWAGSLGGKDGINVVAGTGSIGYGERQGQSARAGGWGEVFGDEGSAYWVAIQGLNVFARMSDGRLPKGPLYAILKSALRLSADLDLCATIMDARARDSIAAMSRLVAQAAQQGDGRAARIFEDAARELAEIVAAVRHALRFKPNEVVPVSYSGGVFNAGELILGPFRRQLEGQHCIYDLEPPVVAPSIGAAIYAAKLAAQPLSRLAIERLRNRPQVAN